VCVHTYTHTHTHTRARARARAYTLLNILQYLVTAYTFGCIKRLLYMIVVEKTFHSPLV